MSAVCADCHIHFANRKDLEASPCKFHNLEALIEQAREVFQGEMTLAKRIMPDVSPMNYPPAKKAWAKLQRLEKSRA